MKQLSSNQRARRGSKADRRRVTSRSELQQELTEVARHRAAISEVLRAIASSPHDLQPIFDTIIGSATRLCRANAGTLRLYEEKGLRLVAQLLQPNTLLERWSPPMLLEPGSSLLAHLANGSPVLVPDLARDSDFHSDLGIIHVAKSVGFRTFLGVPMLAEDRLIGTIYIGRLRRQPFTDKEIELITDFAAQAAIALEITRRERQFREAQMRLAHANRLATMGQLMASITHEVNQPIAGTITNAQAALRWLAGQPPNLEEVRQALTRIVNDGNRVGEVIAGIRALVKKAPQRKHGVTINDAIQEVVALTHNEAMKNRVSVQTQLAEGLPLIEGDRVQLQQVMLNLIINAVEAMSGVTKGARDLLISTGKADSEDVLVSVRDSGPGLAPAALEGLFDAFYSTKPSGLGLGLSICRSIIEAHGGRLWATGLHPHGALFQFTIPAR
jgi:C4-dicarboxylate-specific signal transduction histidine kinase